MIDYRMVLVASTKGAESTKIFTSHMIRNALCHIVAGRHTDTGLVDASRDLCMFNAPNGHCYGIMPDYMLGNAGNGKALATDLFVHLHQTPSIVIDIGYIEDEQSWDWTGISKSILNYCLDLTVMVFTESTPEHIREAQGMLRRIECKMVKNLGGRFVLGVIGEASAVKIPTDIGSYKFVCIPEKKGELLKLCSKLGWSPYAFLIYCEPYSDTGCDADYIAADFGLASGTSFDERTVVIDWMERMERTIKDNIISPMR